MENMHLPTEILNILNLEIVILEVEANDTAKTSYNEGDIVFPGDGPSRGT